ncbi:MAG: hypothetical protein ABIH10_01495 [Spirochaetota bacterium]
MKTKKEQTIPDKTERPPAYSCIGSPPTTTKDTVIAFGIGIDFTPAQIPEGTD